MAELNRKYNKIMSELEEKIKDSSELEFVKNKISELTVTFMDTIERLAENSERQAKIENDAKTRTFESMTFSFSAYFFYSLRSAITGPRFEAI